MAADRPSGPEPRMSIFVWWVLAMIVLLLIDCGRSDRFLIRSHRAKSRCPSALRGDDGCLDFARHERDNRTVRSRWVLQSALARDRLRAKGREQYGKQVGSSWRAAADRSEEPTSELQSLMRISYAVLCLKKK